MQDRPLEPQFHEQVSALADAITESTNTISLSLAGFLHERLREITESYWIDESTTGFPLNCDNRCTGQFGLDQEGRMGIDITLRLPDVSPESFHSARSFLTVLRTKLSISNSKSLKLLDSWLGEILALQIDAEKEIFMLENHTLKADFHIGQDHIVKIRFNKNGYLRIRFTNGGTRLLKAIAS